MLSGDGGLIGHSAFHILTPCVDMVPRHVGMGMGDTCEHTTSDVGYGW